LIVPVTILTAVAAHLSFNSSVGRFHTTPTDDDTVSGVTALPQQVDAEHLYWLGMAQRTGRGAPKDPRRGFDTLKRAAAAGSGSAMLQLGLAYAEGVGSVRAQGYMWLLLAEYNLLLAHAAEAETARQALNALEAQLPPKQIDAALAEARRRISTTGVGPADR
jgi:TPR repeat protein